MNGSSFSLRLGITLYLNYPKKEISILNDIYGFERAPTRISLREKATFLEKYVKGRKELIEYWNQKYIDIGFGTFKSDGKGRSFAQMAAGLISIKDRNLLQDLNLISISPLKSVNSPYDPMPPEEDVPFPTEVEIWIKSQVEKHRDPGTDGDFPEKSEENKTKDYDMWMMEMVSLLYVFKDKDDDQLLTDAACIQLIQDGLKPLLGQKKFLKYPITVAPWLYAIFITIAALAFAFAVPAFLIGTSAAFLLSFGVGVALSVITAILMGLDYPETENHVLMTHSSIYLANQWVKENPREINFESEKYADLELENSGGPIEDLLLQAAGRVVYNDFFETNGRPYRSLSIHSLIMLFSYADPKKVSISAQNALDFSTLKFAAQSLKGQEYCPFRRNYENATKESLYEKDNIPRLMGALSAERAWDDDSFEVFEEDNGDKWEPGARVALWSCLMDYRIPHLFLDFMHDHGDLERQAAGYWTRCQARFSNDHYQAREEPKYFNSDGTIFQNTQTFRIAPEFYFRTPKFINSWGGTFNRYKVLYDGILARADKAPKGSHEYDRLTRNSIVLMGNPPFPNWRDDVSPTQMGRQVLHAVNPKDSVWNSTSSCYKSFTYAIVKSGFTPSSNVLGSVSVPWKLHSEDSVSSFTTEGTQISINFSFFDLSSNNQEGNDNLGLYIVVGVISIQSDETAARAFWEVVPDYRFPTVDRLEAFIITRNANSVGNEGFRYHMTTEDIIALTFPLPSDTNGILHITDPEGNILVPDDMMAINEEMNFPLIEILEVDGQYQFTGRRFAKSSGNGIVNITNHFMNFELTLNSSDYRNPSRSSNILMR